MKAASASSLPRDIAADVGVVPAVVRASHDGIELLRRMIDGDLPQPPITKSMGFRLVDAGPGYAVVQGLPGRRHLNPIGTVHGGFAMTLLDSALAWAIFSLVPKGRSWSTVEFKVNFIRPISSETGPVRAKGQVVHHGRTLAVAQGDLLDRDDKLYAHATATCMIVPLDANRLGVE